MDHVAFDRLTLQMSRLVSRRATLGSIAASGLAVTLRWSTFDGDAKKNRKRKKKKIKRNDFGCVNVGGFCKNSGQCCSGICQGRKDKKKCQAHDTGGCQGEPGQDRCLDVEVNCVTEFGIDGFCVRTTGNAGYCEATLGCFACTKDVDCVPFCGPQAACIVCSGCAEQVGTDTACVGPANNSCSLPV